MPLWGHTIICGRICVRVAEARRLDLAAHTYVGSGLIHQYASKNKSFRLISARYFLWFYYNSPNCLNLKCFSVKLGHNSKLNYINSNSILKAYMSCTLSQSKILQFDSKVISLRST